MFIAFRYLPIYPGRRCSLIDRLHSSAKSYIRGLFSWLLTHLNNCVNNPLSIDAESPMLTPWQVAVLQVTLGWVKPRYFLDSTWVWQASYGIEITDEARLGSPVRCISPTLIMYGYSKYLDWPLPEVRLESSSPRKPSTLYQFVTFLALLPVCSAPKIWRPGSPASNIAFCSLVEVSGNMFLVADNIDKRIV